ncbi:Spy/CpxP family protein refolding chaperone [uncultured Oxalicibacterium sp.]|uniref:Spy/CpxP family protein refolding chaperone n=1 Tax=uncultured Oxalicibacterium sp. TaxID=1168540 RepID=UPI0025DEA1AB|nr:Spy/CpxP family protein refolding chaperone [uncultured Oxalicibacterium sp.]
MNKQQSPTSLLVLETGARSRRLLAAGVTAAILGSMSLVGVSHAQVDTKPAPNVQQNAPQKPERPDGKRERMNPEQRFDRMINRLVPDASADQKARLKVISQTSFKEMGPLHDKGRELRDQRTALLAAPKIDRQALEQNRVAEQQLADQRSRIMTKTLADAAEVLTPAQRVKAAEEMKKHRGPFGFEHGRHHGGPDHKPGRGDTPPPPPPAK